MSSEAKENAQRFG